MLEKYPQDVQTARLWLKCWKNRTKLLPHTEESGAAVLDIFNKLKPRYKKTMYISYPPSPPPPTTLSFNCDKHCFIFPPQKETAITDRGSVSTDSQIFPHTEYVCPLNPETLDKTHTCYMSAGTSDKTEGLDWDKVYQRPQSTFQCWVLLDVNWSCWFTRQCILQPSRHFSNNVSGIMDEHRMSVLILAANAE